MDAHSRMGSPYYNRSLLVYPVLKVVGVVSYIIHSNRQERQVEHLPLCIQVRESSGSLNSLPGEAVRLVKEAWQYDGPFPKLVRGQTDKQIHRHTQNMYINVID